MPAGGHFMIPDAAMVSTASSPSREAPIGRRAFLGCAAALTVGLTGCAGGVALPGKPGARAGETDGAFVMRDGALLPYRCWLPRGGPLRGLILALHGFNDSRDAWEVPAAQFTAAGYALYAPDQRGFGATPERGLWPGVPRLVADASESAWHVRALHPGVPLVLMGESMGGAVLMCLATGPWAPMEARYVLVSPAVWGRADMNVVYRSSLWLGAKLAPGLALTGAPVSVTASDNASAIIRLSRDPLTIHATRLGTLRGLVDLMDAALASAARFRAPGLFLYGGRDELVPKAATADMWRRLPAGPAITLAYYPDDYHLMLRDLHRAVPIDDIRGWMSAPSSPLPSAADRAALAWLANRTA